jgi:D-lactate dehydrogenase
MALDTCAVDGLCAAACPVAIDTGQLTKRFRRLRHSTAAHAVAHRLAIHFALLEPTLRLGLRMGHLVQSLFGTGTMVALTRGIRAVVRRPVPVWSRDMPRAARARRPVTERAGAQAVYFPSCISRVMGRLPGEPAGMSLMEAFVTVARRASVPVWIPGDVEGTCCGVPFSSKGYDLAHDVAVNRAIERFWEWSDRARLPIVLDTSPCSYGLTTCRASLTPENREKFDQLRILDSVAFVHDQLLPRLTIRRTVSSVALHPVCSVIKLNLSGKLEKIARACGREVIVPFHAGCCGFAGDRGFLFPELTEAATRREADELHSSRHDGYYSSSRTCEIGMSRATGHVYRSYLYLLEQATRP